MHKVKKAACAPTARFIYPVLGADAPTRAVAYRELSRHELTPGPVDAIRKAANGNFAMGDDSFGAHIAHALGRRTQPSKAVRPLKN
jgi:putative transposase